MGINAPKLGDPLKVLEVTLGAGPEGVAEGVVITPFMPLKSFSRLVDEGSMRELAPRFFYRGFTATYRGSPVTVILSGVGPSRVGDLVSILSLTNCKRVVFVGAVGALRSDWSIGDAFLTVEAAEGEGYTRYALEDFSAIVEKARIVEGSGWSREELCARFGEEGIGVRTGRVFTIGSIAFEERENLELLAARGFDAIEMELSAFFAASARHGLRADALTYVSDLPLASSLWQSKSEEEKAGLARAWRTLPQIALGHVAKGF